MAMARRTCLPMSEIRRTHAKLFPALVGGFVPYEQSLYETFVNDLSILEPVQLHAGDCLRMCEADQRHRFSQILPE
jgi:hypothetical protein